jgi:type VI secretion system protein ImpC
MAQTQTEQGPLQGVEYAGGEFAALLQKEFKPRSDEAKSAVETAVQTLAQQALAQTQLIGKDVTQSITAMIAAIDAKLTEQVNKIIHHPDYQQLESAWRGLSYMVNNTETDENLKIRVMDISKKELAKNLKKFKGTAWDQSPIFKKIYEQEYGQFGGEPFGAIVGDYFFDQTPPDVELLGEMAKIGAAAHAPFISGASPSLMQMESWQELANPRDLTKIFLTPEYAAWRSLRESDDSKYLGLCMPRFLARAPYGANTNPVEEFDFEEDTAGADHSKYAWANAAYAMATNINRSYKLYGWGSRIRGIESGGAVENLPLHTFPSDDGGVDQKCPTEIAISDRREAELSKAGLLSMIHRKNSDFAAFIGAQSLNKPFEYDDPDATANANLAARLPYLFACNRFAHYLKCIVRDKIGSFKERTDMERWLNKWIMNYVDGDPANSSEATKAKRPLAAAEVVVEEVEGNPGYYTSKFFLRPHYQLEGLTVSLRLVSRLPSAKGTA